MPPSGRAEVCRQDTGWPLAAGARASFHGAVIPTPDLLFRLLGYGGLALAAALYLSQGGPSGLWLLLLFACIWPAVWIRMVRRAPRMLAATSRLGALAHAGECCLITAVTALAGLGFWPSTAVGLLCLTGVTALGGVRLFIPAALLLCLTLILTGWLTAQVVVPAGAALAGITLAAGFLVGLAGLSHARVRRLNVERQRVLTETRELQDLNNRLARYLPEVPPWEAAPREAFVTVAFIDVVGFVELVAARPVAEISEVLNDFLAHVHMLTTRRGGTVSKFLGDGVLVYFAAASPVGPGRQGEDRCRAAGACARLCLDLGPSLAGLNAAWRRRGLSLDLHVRAGMASGYCAIGNWGGEGRLDFTVIGTPVNVASRLQGQAREGGILLTDATADLLRQDGTLSGNLENLGPRDVRGVGRVVVHALTASAKVRAIPLPAAPARPF